MKKDLLLMILFAMKLGSGASAELCMFNGMPFCARSHSQSAHSFLWHKQSNVHILYNTLYQKFMEKERMNYNSPGKFAK